MKFKKGIISTLALATIISGISINSLATESFANEYEDNIRYTLNENGDTVIQDGEMTAVIGQPSFTIKNMETGEETTDISSLNLISEYASIGGGVSDVTRLTITHPNRVTQKYPFTMYIGGKKVATSNITASLYTTPNRAFGANMTMSKPSVVSGSGVTLSSNSTSNGSQVTKGQSVPSFKIVLNKGGSKYTFSHKLYNIIESVNTSTISFKIKQYWT